MNRRWKCMVLSFALFFASVTGRSDEEAAKRMAELRSACESGDATRAAELLAEGADPNADAEGFPKKPFHVALAGGRLEIVRLFLDKGARIVELPGGGSQPLAVAAGAWENALDSTLTENSIGGVIDLLLARGADVHADGEAAVTAAAGRSLGRVRRLIAAGARPNVGTLAAAAGAAKPDVVEFLIRRGLDPLSRPAKGRTLMHEAADGFWAGDLEADRLKTMELLARHGVDVNAVDDAGRTPLHVAVIEGKSEVIKWLLAHRADVNAADHEGITPLMHAVADSFTAAWRIETLLRAGARIDIRNRRGQDALELAVDGELWDAVALLLRADAKPSDPSGLLAKVVRCTLKDHARPQALSDIAARVAPLISDLALLKIDGNPPLVWAVRLRLEKAARALIDAKADVNARDPDGRTALIWAAISESGEIEQMLNAAGADESVRDRFARTAADWKDGTGEDPVREGIEGRRENAPPTSDPRLPGSGGIFEAVSARQPAAVEDALRRDADAAKRKLAGLSPLHLAVWMGEREIAMSLIAGGMSEDAPTDDGMHPVELAIMGGHIGLMRRLLDGCRADRRGAVLAAAGAAALNHRSAAALRSLVEAGWRPDPSRESQNSLTVAARLGDAVLLKMLLDLGAKPQAATEDPFALERRENIFRLLTGHRDTAGLLVWIEATAKEKSKEWNRDRNAALCSSACIGNLPAVRALVETGGADVNGGSDGNKRGDGGERWGLSPSDEARLTPICAAVEGSQIETVRYLLSKNAQPAECDGAGRGLLAAATVAGNREVFDLILSAGAALEARDGEGCTALHVAAENGRRDFAEALILKGAVADATDEAGRTPSRVARDAGFDDLSKWLNAQAGKK